MIRRWRPAIFALALLLTGAALYYPAQATECTEGSWSWMNLGDCCWQFNPPPGKLHLMRCVGGQWTVFGTSYKCPPTEPCG
jgi:hypothetical protein